MLIDCLAEIRIKPKQKRYDKIHEMDYRPIRCGAMGYLFSPN